MAGEIDKVAGAGLGFFSKSGELKSQEELASESKPVEKRPTEIKETSNDDPASLLRSGIGATKERVVKQANDIASVANEDRANLRAALNQNDKELAKAREIKKAIDEGDSEKEEKARKEFDELRASRDDLASRIESSNRENSGRRVKNLSVGNQQKGIVKVEEVRFEKSQNEPTESKKDINNIIDQLKTEKQDLKGQLDQNKASRKEIEGVVKEARTELNSIEKNSIQSIEEAERTASKLSSDISRQGSQAVLSNKLNESVVRSLLA